VDVRGVGALAVAREREHVRLRLAGGDAVDDLVGLGIDDRDRVGDLGRDVEPAVGPEHRAVRPLGAAEVDRRHPTARRDVDDVHGLPVGAGAADAGVAVDGHVGRAAVGRGDHLVAGDAALLDRRHLAARDGIDDAQSVIALVGHEQQAAHGRRGCVGHA